MTFKDAVANDLNNVFFDKDEHAEKHIIDGKRMTVVIDQNMTNKHGNPRHEGVMDISMALFVRAALLGYRPVEDQPMTVDGNVYYVRKVDEAGGAYEIWLEAVDE